MGGESTCHSQENPVNYSHHVSRRRSFKLSLTEHWLSIIHTVVTALMIGWMVFVYIPMSPDTLSLLDRHIPPLPTPLSTDTHRHGSSSQRKRRQKILFFTHLKSTVDRRSSLSSYCGYVQGHLSLNWNQLSSLNIIINLQYFQGFIVFLFFK